MLKTKERKRSRFQAFKRHPLRLTALLCLREALLAENYEECASMVAIAREFGADAKEVQYLLEDARRVPRLS